MVDLLSSPLILLHPRQQVERPVSFDVGDIFFAEGLGVVLFHEGFAEVGVDGAVAFRRGAEDHEGILLGACVLQIEK